MSARQLLAVATITMTCLIRVAPASTTQTWGASSAVTSPDRSTSFDSLNFAGNGTPLSNYNTANIAIHTNGNSYYGDNAVGQIGIDGVVSPGSPYFNPFHIYSAQGPGNSYANAGGGYYFAYDGQFGNSDWFTISTTDHVKIYAVEFLYGNGWTTGDSTNPWGNSGAYLDWKTLVAGNVVSSGQVGVSEFLGVGTVLGFSDPVGFDQLMIRAPHPNSGSQTLQELAIDNLVVQITVPEPSLMLFPLGTLMALRRIRR